jgi:hypothetical protein
MKSCEDTRCWRGGLYIVMPHTFRITAHRHGSWGSPPGLRPTPRRPLAVVQRTWFFARRAGPGGPAQTRGSAPQIPQHSQCWKQYVALGYTARGRAFQRVQPPEGGCGPGWPPHSAGALLFRQYHASAKRDSPTDDKTRSAVPLSARPLAAALWRFTPASASRRHRIYYS